MPDLRPMRPDDAAAVSALIGQTLRISNAADYPPAEIDRIAAAFSPQAVAGLLAQRQVWVLQAPDGLIGTAALQGDSVRTVFVRPDAQGQGHGTRLLAAVEAAAKASGVATLHVQSSLTAQEFYRRQGFAVQGLHHHGAEVTVLMAKPLRDA